MYKAWQEMRQTSSFLLNIHIAHAFGMAWNWIYQLLNSISEMAPQYVMFELLKVLQRRDNGQEVTQVAIIWVIALGVSQLVGAFTNGRMW
jgi:hypothetical protein